MVVYYDCFVSAMYKYFSSKKKESLNKFIWEDKYSKIKLNFGYRSIVIKINKINFVKVLLIDVYSRIANLMLDTMVYSSTTEKSKMENRITFIVWYGDVDNR